MRFKTDPDVAWIEGRNGIFDIPEVDIWYGGIPIAEAVFVTIGGVGKRGNIIRGGLTVSAETMDELCSWWISQRKKGDY